MILQICAAYDSKARAFIQPFYAAHADVAVRAFRAAANQPGHQVCDNPEDFTLFHLGQWDDQTCHFTLFPEHRNLGLASNFKGVVDVQSEKP